MQKTKQSESSKEIQIDCILYITNEIICSFVSPGRMVSLSVFLPWFLCGVVCVIANMEDVKTLIGKFCSWLSQVHLNSQSSYWSLSILTELGFRISEVAELIGCTKRTLERRMSASGLSVRGLYTDVTDFQLEDLVRQISRENDALGEKMLRQRLSQLGIRVQRRRLRQAIRNTTGPQLLHRRVKRRVYKVRGPLSMVHLDGNHKLIRWQQLSELKLYTFCIPNSCLKFLGGDLLYMGQSMDFRGWCITCECQTIIGLTPFSTLLKKEPVVMDYLLESGEKKNACTDIWNFTPIRLFYWFKSWSRRGKLARCSVHAHHPRIK